MEHGRRQTTCDVVALLPCAVLACNVWLYEEVIIPWLVYRFLVNIFLTVCSCSLLIVCGGAFLGGLLESGAIERPSKARYGFERGLNVKTKEKKSRDNDGALAIKTVRSRNENVHRIDVLRIVYKDKSQRLGKIRNIDSVEVQSQEIKEKHQSHNNSETHRPSKEADEILLLFILAELSYVLGNAYGQIFLPWLLYKLFVSSLYVAWLSLTDIVHVLWTYPFLVVLGGTLSAHYVEKKNERNGKNRQFEEERVIIPVLTEQRESVPKGIILPCRRNEKNGITGDITGVVMLIVLGVCNLYTVLNFYHSFLLPKLIYWSLTYVLHLLYAYPWLLMCCICLVVSVVEQERAITYKNDVIDNKEDTRNSIMQFPRPSVGKSYSAHVSQGTESKVHHALSILLSLLIYAGTLGNQLLLPWLVYQSFAHILFLTFAFCIPLVLLAGCCTLHYRRLLASSPSEGNVENNIQLLENEKTDGDNLVNMDIVPTEIQIAEMINMLQCASSDYDGHNGNDWKQTTKSEELTEPEIREIAGIMRSISTDDEANDELEILEISDMINLFKNKPTEDYLLEGVMTNDKFGDVQKYMKGSERNKSVVIEDLIIDESGAEELESGAPGSPVFNNISEEQFKISDQLFQSSPPKQCHFDNIPPAQFQISEQLFQSSVEASLFAAIADEAVEKEEAEEEEEGKDAIDNKNNNNNNNNNNIDMDSELHFDNEHFEHAQKDLSEDFEKDFYEYYEYGDEDDLSDVESDRKDTNVPEPSPSWEWGNKSLVFRNIPRLFSRMRKRMSLRTQSIENLPTVNEEEVD